MRIRQIDGITALEYEHTDPVLTTPAQVVDLIGECFGTDARLVIIPAARLAADFFVLRTGFAGEVFQKFQNYHLRLAIVGDIEEHVAASNALRDFVRETSRIGNHMFVADEAELTARLASPARV